MIMPEKHDFPWFANDGRYLGICSTIESLDSSAGVDDSRIQSVLEGVRSTVIVYRLYRYDWLFCDAHHSSMHLLYSVNGCCWCELYTQVVPYCFSLSWHPFGMVTFYIYEHKIHMYIYIYHLCWWYLSLFLVVSSGSIQELFRKRKATRWGSPVKHGHMARVDPTGTSVHGTLR